MKIQVNKKFLKDLARLSANNRQKIESFVFVESQMIQSIESEGVFEKLKGYQHYYRARFGNYRVGVRYEDGVLIFERSIAPERYLPVFSIKGTVQLYFYYARVPRVTKFS